MHSLFIMRRNRASGLVHTFKRRFCSAPLAPPRSGNSSGKQPTIGVRVESPTDATGADSLGNLPIIVVDNNNNDNNDNDIGCGGSVDDDQLSCSTFTLSDTTTVRTSFSSSVRTRRSHRSSSQNKSQRRVGFATSRNGDGGVLTDVHVIVSYPGERAVSALTGDPICHFAKYQEDALKAIEEECCGRLLNSLDKMYFGMVFSADAESEAKRMQGMASWSRIEDGKYRGLEATLMKRAHKRRIGHRRHVLEKQETIRREGPFLNMDEQLRRASRKYTKASAEFSMLLAVGDSMALHGHDQALSDHQQQEEPEVVVVVGPDEATRAEL